MKTTRIARYDCEKVANFHYSVVRIDFNNHHYYEIAKVENDTITPVWQSKLDEDAETEARILAMGCRNYINSFGYRHGLFGGQ